ncbi:hypothetical protein [Citreicoccus inhibens]|nr:hypothetical protein [Citreicoccus inhibens]
MEQREDQERRRSVLSTEEEAKATAPQADIEDSFLESLALVPREVAVGT